ncbi:MAG: histidine phosphatase family protein [Thermoplasmata archaeon]|nr:histidine phosphatase family protein [Thermoplasmata archaeon]
MIKFAILVRHGESVSNTMNIVSRDIDKYPLTEKGRNQVKFTGNELKKIKLEKIVTSPVLRAKETAEIISKIIDIPFKIDERLIEIGFGKFNNGPFQITPKFTYESKEMETWENIEKRMLACINDYSGNVLFVSHAFTIRVLISHFLSLDENESFGISISNASISVLDVQNKRVLAIGSPVITEKLEKKIGKS